QPRATDTLTFVGDTTKTDTLWLSFRPLQSHASFIAFEATLLFRPALGESLSTWWYEVGPEGVPPHMTMRFEPKPGLGYPQPFAMNGAGGWRWDRLRKDARLRLVYAVPYMDGRSVDSTQYVAGCIIVRHPPAKTPASHEPVCVEWVDSRLSWYVGSDVEVVREGGGNRFVSVNSPQGEITLPYRRATRVPAWRLKDQ
ncbi:MAG TPA: hypothetical protein VL123_04840, partial [Candidatus Udaeobacter sp.]|nr:hypothetical protein [Candidatus Udaeobacter sp.]